MHYILEVSCYWLGFYLIYVLWLSKETFFATNRSYLLVTLLAGLWLPTLQLQTLGITHPEWIHHFDPVILGVEQLETRLSAVATHSLTSDWAVSSALSSVKNIPNRTGIANRYFQRAVWLDCFLFIITTRFFNCE